MLITDRVFFCEKLDKNIPELSDIDVTYREKGLEAAEKQLADFLKKSLCPEKYFKIPYYGRENAWAYNTEDDYVAAERVMQGKLMACGYMHQFPQGKIDWQSNPTFNGYREWTWQLSRHHEFRCLGRCYRETGDEKYAKAFTEMLMSWCEQAQCPENERGGATLCWRTIEAGIRMTKNWHYAIHAFYNSPYMTDHVITTYMKSIWEHGYRLRNFCTGANWLIMEIAGLSHIVMIYPWFVESKDWEEYAFKRLSEEIDVQVYPDGFQYELSTGYHGTVISNYDWIINTAKALEYPIPQALEKNFERCFEMYIKLMEPDGKTPCLNDGGRAAASSMSALGLRYFPQREDFRYFATGGKEGKKPEYNSIALPYSGMASMRTGWGKDDTWFFMESAPFGKGHQHEDKLSVLMYAYGKEVLSDTGNYAYDSSEMRRFVLDTRSHNCAMVDDLCQNRRKKYVWIPEMISQRSDMKWNFTSEWDSVEGIYNEGYGPELIDVTHTRKSVFFKKGLINGHPFAVVIDRLYSADGSEHDYQVSYQMNKDPYSAEGRIFTSDMGDGVKMNIIGTVEPKIIIAQKEPLYMGWRPMHVAGGLEPEHYHAPCVRFIESGAQKRIVTVLYPTKDFVLEISAVKASDDINDTKITLCTYDGKEIVIDEKDFPCSDASEEKFI